MEENSFYFDELDLKGIWQDVKQNLVAILLAMLSAVMLAAVFFNMVYKEKYTSEATIAIRSTTTSYQTTNEVYSQLSTSTSMAEALSKVFTSDILWEKLEAELGYEPKGKLSVSQVGTTNLVLLEMTADRAGQAYRELNLLMENYAEFSDYVFSNAELTVISEPDLPQEPSNKVEPWIYGPVAALLALFLCIGYIVVAFIFRRTVKNKASAEHWVDGPVYGTIAHEKKSFKKNKSAILITNPTCSVSLDRAFSRLASRTVMHMDRKGQQVLLVTSGAENEGKSTISVNIALAMAKRGRKVLIVDTDFRKPAIYKVFDYNKEESTFVDFSEYLVNGGDMKELLVRDKRSGVYLAMCRESMESPETLITSDRLKEFIQQMRQEMDYIVLDTPPAGFLGDSELLAALADTAVLVVRRDGSHVSQINYALNNLRNSGVDLLGCILNDMLDESSSKNGKTQDHYTGNQTGNQAGNYSDNYAGAEKKIEYSRFNTRKVTEK